MNNHATTKDACTVSTAITAQVTSAVTVYVCFTQNTTVLEFIFWYGFSRQVLAGLLNCHLQAKYIACFCSCVEQGTSSRQHSHHKPVHGVESGQLHDNLCTSAMTAAPSAQHSYDSPF